MSEIFEEEKTSRHDPSPETLDIAALMMKNIVEFGRFSYELEEKREQSLITQSSHMLTAFSVFSAALFMVVPIVLEYTTVNAEQLLLCLLVISTFLLISLVLAILAQWRYKYKTMADINEFYNQVNAEHENYRTQAQFDMQWQEQLHQIQTSKKKNNDIRSKLIMASMRTFLFASMFLALSVFLLVFYNLGG